MVIFQLSALESKRFKTEELQHANRVGGASLKVVGLTSDSKWGGGGGGNTFFSITIGPGLWKIAC